MWIFIGIVAFLALLIFIIMMIPVYIIVKTDENGEFIIRYKLLNKIYGENPDPNQPIIKLLKESVGVTRLEKSSTKGHKHTTMDTLRYFSDSFSLIIGLFKRLLQLLKYCTVTKLKINVVCADEDASQAAVNYGIAYSIISPLLGMAHSLVKVRPRGEKINVSCDYSATETKYDFDVVLMVRFFRVLSAIIRASYDEYKRDPAAYQNAAQQKSKSKKTNQQKKKE